SNRRAGSFSVAGSTVPSETEDSPDSTPSARPLRSMQTGQNSIAPENSLPQLGHVRWGSVFINLTGLQPEFEAKPIPHSGESSPLPSDAGFVEAFPLGPVKVSI